MCSDVKKKLSYLKKDLIDLRDRYSVVGLKTGTEIEDMDTHEIKIMREISLGVMPFILKIGGAEARQDIRFALSLKIDCILAPMIESVYALNKFVETVDEIQIEHNQPLSLAFNLETISAAQILDRLIEVNAFAKIQQVTIGRDDLSKSMQLDINDKEVMKVVQESTKKIKKKKKIISLGGGLSLINIQNIVNEVETDYLNTRHIIFNNNTVVQKRATDILLKILNWEKMLYSTFVTIFPKRKKYYKHRISTIIKRCQV